MAITFTSRVNVMNKNALSKPKVSNSLYTFNAFYIYC